MIVRLPDDKDSIAVALATAKPSAPRYVGTRSPRLAELTKTISHLDEMARRLIAREVGRSGFSLVR